MGGIVKVLGALGAGALLMYLFDPKGGNRRRAMIRDKAVGLSNDVRRKVQAKTHDLSNRAKGFVHDAKGLIPERGQTQAEAERRV